MRRVYLDHQGTTRPDPRVVATMLPFLSECFGDPVSRLESGTRPRAAVEEARRSVADLLGARTDEIHFTGSGTEANVWALKGVARAIRSGGSGERGRTGILLSAIEHASVRGAARALEADGFHVTPLPVGRDGILAASTLESAVGPGTAIVSVVHASNEAGVVEPIPALARIARDAGALFHTDAAQTAGKVAIAVRTLGVDLLTVSAHKMHGPRGAGALFVRSGVPIAPLVEGGFEEAGLRGGMPDVAAIAGFGEAARIAREEGARVAARIVPLRDRLREGILSGVRGTCVVPDAAVDRLPGHLAVLVNGVSAEALVLALDEEGIEASIGTAVPPNTYHVSETWLALGLDRDEAMQVVVFSAGRETTGSQIDAVIRLLPRVVERLRALGARPDAERRRRSAPAGARVPAREETR